MPLVRPLLSDALRHYPFYSGFEKIALSKLLALFARGETYAVARLRGGEQMLVCSKDHVGRTILYMGDFDPRISYVARKLLRPGDCALDIGSNLGWFAIVASSAVGKAGCVHAFEPQPLLNDLFRASLRMNGIENVTLHEVALSDRDGTADFHILAGNRGAGRLDQTAGSLWSKIEVHTVHAGAYLEALDLPPIRLMKIDIEGHEETVLRTAEQFFRNRPPDAILFESAGSGPLIERPVARWLIEYGYALFSFANSFRQPKIVPARPNQIVATIDHLAVRMDLAGSFPSAIE